MGQLVNQFEPVMLSGLTYSEPDYVSGFQAAASTGVLASATLRMGEDQRNQSSASGVAATPFRTTVFSGRWPETYDKAIQAVGVTVFKYGAGANTAPVEDIGAAELRRILNGVTLTIEHNRDRRYLGHAALYADGTGLGTSQTGRATPFTLGPPHVVRAGEPFSIIAEWEDGLPLDGAEAEAGTALGLLIQVTLYGPREYPARAKKT